MNKGKNVSADSLNAESTPEEKATFAQAEAIYNEQMKQQNGGAEMVQTDAKHP